MDNPMLATLSRQVGLDQAMRIVANNIANISTAGFRREGAVFAEIVSKVNVDGGAISQTAALVRTTDYAQGVLHKTGGTFDIAIEGDGFFLIETPDGPALTRAGAFTRAATGELMAPDGARLLDAGGAPVVTPQTDEPIAISTDGTVSAGGAPVAQIAVVTVEDLSSLTRMAEGRFAPPNGVADIAPVEDPRVFQGFVEHSNVNPVRELTRMIEIQRAYEAGQALLTQEHERIRQATRVMSGS